MSNNQDGRKLDGELVFVVGEVRQWLVEHEETVVPGRSEPMMMPIRQRGVSRATR